MRVNMTYLIKLICKKVSREESEIVASLLALRAEMSLRGRLFPEW